MVSFRHVFQRSPKSIWARATGAREGAGVEAPPLKTVPLLGDPRFYRVSDKPYCSIPHHYVRSTLVSATDRPGTQLVQPRPCKASVWRQNGRKACKQRPRIGQTKASAIAVAALGLARDPELRAFLHRFECVRHTPGFECTPGDNPLPTRGRSDGEVTEIG